MDVDLLKAFCKLANRSSYRLASHDLFITQSALTKKIQRLESRIGTLLFVRGTNGVELTQAGKAILPEAQKVLAHMEAFCSFSSDVAEGAIGNIRIGYGISTYYAAPLCVAAFKQKYPNVHITLDDMPSKTQFELLENGTLNVSFNRIPKVDYLDSITLYKDQLVLAVNTCLDVHQDSDNIFELLSDVDFMRIPSNRGPGLVDQINRYLLSRDESISVTRQANDIFTLLSMVSANVGYTIVPATAKNINSLNVKYIPLNGAYSSWDIGMIWNNAYPDPIREKFIHMVKNMSLDGTLDIN